MVVTLAGMDLAKELVRMAARGFYETEYVLIIDALMIHSVFSFSRPESRTPLSNANAAARTFYRDYYYINLHTAIDSLKYRLHKLSAHIAKVTAPTTSKAELRCPTCKSEYTNLQALDNVDFGTGSFLCKRCGSILDELESEEGAVENEAVKRLNDQTARLQGLMRQIDSSAVPENDFETAWAAALPIKRTDANPAAKSEPVFSGLALSSAKGLSIKPDQISVSVTEGEAKEEQTEAQKRAQLAKQNALPEWISRSTINGEITGVGAKEEAARREREAHAAITAPSAADEERKKEKIKEDATDDFFRQMYEQEAAERERREREVENEEDEDDEDEDEDDEDNFEDVPVTVTAAPAGAAKSETAANGRASKSESVTSSSAPVSVSGNATEDEASKAKRVRVDGPTSNGAAVHTEADAEAAAGKAVDVESEEEELDFEDV
ncbi:hypothetical protein LTR50_006701 [Elasticomyces elasticus]|nr:hypothetical protein LTR50_006701 [Elasticomyces elasticus]